ncbi:Oidioi.mRNA.OKI2018_I69.chr1.g3802.t1.cds [Oikopleura dioica]|uniref:Oidioi.mRNA.OKI2018_I69.chr1.g3802.t1.cds n=1 Tax=Oikopleura dioica TaxID=34765 RepID=A0ABN7SVA3_OIKDI|nr:Oidioi.mRNA.OKI2018_I69.chr1.g3802.t1.cds [Oikopleura dioica]
MSAWRRPRAQTYVLNIFLNACKGLLTEPYEIPETPELRRIAEYCNAYKRILDIWLHENEHYLQLLGENVNKIVNARKLREKAQTVNRRLEEDVDECWRSNLTRLVAHRVLLEVARRVPKSFKIADVFVGAQYRSPSDKLKSSIQSLNHPQLSFDEEQRRIQTAFGIINQEFLSEIPIVMRNANEILGRATLPTPPPRELENLLAPESFARPIAVEPDQPLAENPQSPQKAPSPPENAGPSNFGSSTDDQLTTAPESCRNKPLERDLAAQNPVPQDAEDSLLPAWARFTPTFDPAQLSHDENNLLPDWASFTPTIEPVQLDPGALALLNEDPVDFLAL